MPSRLRNAGSSADAAQPESRYHIPGLQYHDSLAWRAGKAIPIADLLNRLQKLGTELRNFDADQVDSHSFTTLAHDLANANLLGHKDKGIRAWTLSCIVDVLRICAPDAPFVESQLKDIFTVAINSILPSLADPSNAYNAQHVYILQSFAESQSILLLTDIPNNDSLIISLFTHAFDIVSTGSNVNGFEISKSVEYHLKNLLAAVVDEVSLPQEVTDIIISQFMRVDARAAPEPTKGRKREPQDNKQGILLLKDYPPAYNMAKSLCTTCPDKMTAHITQYFGTVIVDASAAIQDSVPSRLAHRRFSDLEDSDHDQDSLADLRKAHRLLRELWRACPDVLVNVIPQIEAEFSADAPILRQLATETLGDITSGIGIAGLAQSKPIDPAAYPLPSVEQAELPIQELNPLLTPASPKPFSAVHSAAYQSFFGRRQDKVPAVRIAWTKAASKILFTSAGGIGLNDDERQELLMGLAQALRDPEEHVRLVAIHTLNDFSYHSLINTIGSDGGLEKPDTVFSSLADRVMDRKLLVREEAVQTLARIWGVASRDIEEGVDTVKSIVGDIPNRLLRAFYTSDRNVHALIDKALHESLIPISFPPTKMPSARNESQRQKSKDKENRSQESVVADPDAIRVRRILTLVQGLDSKSRPIFYHLQNLQAQLGKAIISFLQRCEDYNGGVVENAAMEVQLKNQLTNQVEQLSKGFPNPSDMSDDLWKFINLHNRRWYQLIRFAVGPEHDYRTVTKAIKELTKRIRESPSNLQPLIHTILPLLYRSSVLFYNRSHVPAIMDMSRTDGSPWGRTALEILQEISVRNPEVLKYQIQALCKELEEGAPSMSNPEDAGAANTLKACAGFARKYSNEVPKERKFLGSLVNFALYSHSPRAAKHAVSIVLTVADKKDMYAKDLLTKALKGLEPGSTHYLSRLATISQVCLYAPSAAEVEAQAIKELTVTKVLQRNDRPSKKEDPNAWDETPDSESLSKELALKVFVNLTRALGSQDQGDGFEQAGTEAFKYLTLLIENDGEITSKKDTPPAQKNFLRLVAARFILKLCRHNRKCEDFVTPSTFNSLMMVMINPPNAVRKGFVNQLKKYLGHNQLANRWFTAFFLLAFEPDVELRLSTMTWLRSRAQFFSKQQSEKKAHANIMEYTFARLLSLLAHHPDYPAKDAGDFDGELLDFSKYIIFYLSAVATEENLSLIFHIGQRIKGARDGITAGDEANERLYVLSDLAQAVIRNYADLMPAHAKGTNLLQTWPGQVTLPRSLFKALPSHEVAQEIAEKNYLPEDVATGLEKLVRGYVRSLTQAAKQSIRRGGTGQKKRKSEVYHSEDEDDEADAKAKTVKRARKSTLAIRKSPKAKRRASEPASPELPSRKSARTSSAVKYVEADSDEDDAEMAEDDRLASSPRVGKKPAQVDHNARRAAEVAIESADGDDAMDENDDEESSVQNGHNKPELSGTPPNEFEDEESPNEVDVATAGKTKGRGRSTRTGPPSRKSLAVKKVPERSTRASRQNRGGAK
ncbi:hypothetical protein B0A52_03979 [Exophiala mesophila]|uniref:Sister chromatid cohesion protein n=1 Tax=Exophiala mesophila TaxID=212818 RepID=A0A438NAC9_EXOME|nr:hypothetical protein B0A52_03979 [Exophiala mesophila]